MYEILQYDMQSHKVSKAACNQRQIRQQIISFLTDGKYQYVKKIRYYLKMANPQK